MQSRWFHKPLLHAPAHGTSKRVGWLELFYDLIFVASVLQLGDYLSGHATAAGFGMFALHFAPLWVAWTGFSFFANRFTVDDVLHRLLVMANMFAVGAMAIGSRAAMEGRPTTFAVAYTVACAILCAMYLRVWRQIDAGRDYARYWGTVFAVSGITFGLSTLLPTPVNYVLWAVGLVTILVSPLSGPARALQERYPLDMEHLSERYGLLTLIVLGESFVKVLSYLTETGLGEQLSYQLKGFFNLGITCALWWIYFDDIAGSSVKKQRTSWMIWLYGHLPLTLGLTAVGVAVKSAIKIELHEVPADGVRWLLAGSIALVFVSVALLDAATERPHVQINERVRIGARWAAAVVLVLVAQVGGAMTGGVFLAIVTSICAGQVVIDLMMAPVSGTHAGATPSAEVARMRRDGTAAPQVRVQLGEAVRVGLPPELRRDLYFFFLEGSWLRVIGSFVAVYLGLNLLFACLFMLDPAGLGGSEEPGFAEAFFLSVQTLGTIGYGVLHPKSEYANLVVTAEAAVGMLFAAVATGTVLAKAARPRAAVLFAETAVVTLHNGQPTLMLRVANARGNDVVEANVSVSVVMDTVSAEGHHMRRVHDLTLLRSRQPMFGLSWTIQHTITPESPLYGVVFGDHRTFLVIVVTLMGHDGTYGQTIYARKLYTTDDVRPGHRFVDVMSELPDGRLMLDLGKIHDTQPDASSPRTAT